MKLLKKLVLLYLLFVLVKSVASYFILSPSAFSDAYLYSKMARSFFFFQTFNVHGIPYTDFPPLYPMLLSLAFFFKDMLTIYPVMKILNAITSSLIIFPAYLLSKEFLSRKKALISAVIVSLLPVNFSFTPFLMSENLYYPLFLFSIYFIYKSLTNLDIKWDILASLFIILTILARIQGVLLIPILILTVILTKVFKIDAITKNKLILLALTIVLPLLSIFLFNLQSYYFFPEKYSEILLSFLFPSTADYENSFSILRIFPRMLLYLGYLILSSSVIYFLLALTTLKSKNKNLKILFTLTFASIATIISANSYFGISTSAFIYEWLGGRVIGRYIDAVLPLVIILGLANLKQKISKKYLIFSGIILFLSAPLISIPLLPINNMSLTHLGALVTILNSFFTIKFLLIPFAILFFITPFIIKKLNIEMLPKLTIVFLLLLGILNYSAIAYNANTYWHSQDNMQLGIHFNNNFEGSVGFDSRDTGRKITKIDQENLCDVNFCISGFWMNNNIDIAHPEQLKTDFIVSKHNLNLKIVHQQGGIFIYENNNSDSSLQ